MNPDLVVEGRIATLAAGEGFGWVEAIAIAGGRVVAAGSRADLDGVGVASAGRLVLPPDEVALPGLTDAHLHLAAAAAWADEVPLADVPSVADGLAALGAAHASLAPGRWLRGQGWSADAWGAWPLASALEGVVPGRPAAIWAHDHHALWVNETALAAAGIDDRRPDPDGGVIRRDEHGRATGILHESAAALVTRLIPPPAATDVEEAVRRLADRLLALGVVAVHDPGGLAVTAELGPELAAYAGLAVDPSFRLRVHGGIRAEQLDAAIGRGLRSGDPLGAPGGRVRFGWLKLFADGTLGSRTAALLAPIQPEPDRPLPPGTELGVWNTAPARLAELAETAAAAGIATMIHAIGDAAARAALAALEPTARRARLMPRVEHVQLLDAGDVRRFGAGGIAASVQPAHLRADAALARRLWGARAERDGYRLASLLDTGATVAFGTDAPVEPIDPWPALELAVTRRAASWPDDAGRFGAAEALSLPQALRAACVAPALLAREPDRGRLVPGQRADLVVVPAAALAEPVEPGGPLGLARPRLVVVDGEVAVDR